MTPHVVIAGGGIGALEGLLALQDLAGDRVGISDPHATVPSTASSEQLWSPPQKVVGDHLGPYLEALGA